MQRIPKLRAGLAALAGLVATAALAAPAHAGGLTTTAADCGDPLITQPFTPWNDTNHYKLADAGDFEASPPGWTLTGGTKVVAGDATSLIGGASDDSSLSLPAGSSATTPSVCVGMDEPTMRFLARGRTGVLAVSVIAKLQLGLSVTLPIGTVLDGD